MAVPPLGRDASQTAGFLDRRSAPGVTPTSMPPRPTDEDDSPPRLPVPPPPSVIDVRPGEGDEAIMRVVQRGVDKISELSESARRCSGLGEDKSVVPAPGSPIHGVIPT